MPYDHKLWHERRRLLFLLPADIDFDLDQGTVTVGAGTVFSEIEYAASQHGLYVASGWANTVRKFLLFTSRQCMF